MAATDTTARTDEDVLDQLVPRTEAIDITIGNGDSAKTYTQRPLGFFQKMEWTSLVARAMDEMLQSQGGEEIGATMAGLFGPQGLRLSNANDASSLIAAIAKLSAEVPDFLLDSYALWLGVPRERREWAKYTMALPPDEGGLSDNDGLLILETFVDQNLEAIKDFFTEKAPKVWNRAQNRLGLEAKVENATAPKSSSKPQRRTRPATPRR